MPKKGYKYDKRRILKTRISQRRAIENYTSKFERLTVCLPVGTMARIKAQGFSGNAFGNMAILDALDAFESGAEE